MDKKKTKVKKPVKKQVKTSKTVDIKTKAIKQQVNITIAGRSGRTRASSKPIRGLRPPETPRHQAELNSMSGVALSRIHPPSSQLLPVSTSIDKQYIDEEIKRRIGSIPNFRDVEGSGWYNPSVPNDGVRTLRVPTLVETSNISTIPISTQTETPQFADAQTQIITIRRPVRPTEPTESIQREPLQPPITDFFAPIRQPIIRRPPESIAQPIEEVPPPSIPLDVAPLPVLLPFGTPYENWRKRDLVNLAYQISEKNDLGFSKNKLGKKNKDELISIIELYQ